MWFKSNLLDLPNKTYDPFKSQDDLIVDAYGNEVDFTSFGEINTKKTACQWCGNPTELRDKRGGCISCGGYTQ